jgi:hypothetical protein
MREEGSKSHPLTDSVTGSVCIAVCACFYSSIIRVCVCLVTKGFLDDNDMQARGVAHGVAAVDGLCGEHPTHIHR